MASMHYETTVDQGLVRARAYEIWQSRGCPDGSSEQIWFEAERQLRESTAQFKPEPMGKATSTSEVPPATISSSSDAAPRTVSSDSEPPTAGYAAATLGEPYDKLGSEPPNSMTIDKAKKSSANPRRSTRR